MKRTPLLLGLVVMLSLVGCAPTDAPREPQNSAPSAPMATDSALEQPPAALPTPTVHTLTITNLKTMPWTLRIDPPNESDVFEIVSAEWDIPGGDTRYLAAHAVGPTFDGPPGPGNLWADLRTGDRVVVEGQTYRVTAVEETPKAWSDDLDERYKERVAGRLLLVTCIPLEQGGTATSNRIIWTEAE